VTVIRNGVEPGPDRVPSTDGPLQVGTVARLSRAKDHTTLLDGFAAFLRRASSARLEIVGDGAELEMLRGRAHALGITDRVTFAGDQQDVRSRLRAMDVFVTASRTEGLPLAVLEAMAEGCPVICSDIPGHRELVADGTDGRLFPVGDAHALADKLLELATSPALRTRLSQAAQARQREQFGLGAMSAAYLALYERLLA
jgi:glycosyltransferase involved in cell wall biosynthesis